VKGLLVRRPENGKIIVRVGPRTYEGYPVLKAN
jgi:hypothetical protein